MRIQIAHLIGLAFLFASGCVDSAQEEAAQTDDPLRATTTELHEDVQSALDQFGAEMEQLDQRYSSATDNAAAAWSDMRSEIQEHREGLETDLARLEGASVEEAQRLKREMAQDLERLTERLERARLESIEADREFLSASRDRVDRLEEDLRALGDQTASLSADAREEASDEVEELRNRASELETRLDGLTDATGEEIASQRSAIAEAIGALVASVRRELFEMRHGVTD